MDISQTTAPKSDQQNFDDYASGSKTVTITEVSAGSAEQPVEIHLAEFPGRPFKPSKSMRRVIVAAWGAETSTYTGRRMTLYGDPTVKFGGAVVGGIRISHLSHLDKPLLLALTVTRGKRAPFRVQPLPDAPARPAETGEAPDQAMNAALFAGLKDIGLTEKAPILQYVGKVLGRDVASSKDLTRVDVSAVLDAIEADRATPAADEDAADEAFRNGTDGSA